jgi:hypothetical protein
VAIACIATIGKKEAGATLDEKALEKQPINERIAAVALRMHTSPRKVKECFHKSCSVAHLWAAVVLHAHGYMQDRVAYRGARLHDLFTTHAGLPVLLATARPVQDFARSYRDPTKGKPIDFGPAPWWVPPDGLHLAPDWSLVEPRDLVLKVMRDYRA